MTISLEADKENQIISDSCEIVKHILKDRNERVRGKEGTKDVGRGKKAGLVSSVGPTGPTQRIKQNRPTRGLNFGPLKANVDLSVSGKILRVERDCVGRPGGVFAKNQDDEVGTEKEKIDGSTNSGLFDLGLEGNLDQQVLDKQASTSQGVMKAAAV